MSKDIIIQEAGIGKNLTVDALKLNKPGSGSENWVPADGKDLVELDIGGSGTYRASDYNAYGIAVARVEPKYGGGATAARAAAREFKAPYNVAIKEGGKAILASACQLKVNNQGSGASLWVPRSEVTLKTKHITESGVYAASDEYCYGFSEVTVSNVDVEIETDGDGDEYAKIHDGDRVLTIPMPDSIVIDVPPSKLDYREGEAINYAGMVVKGYMHSGRLWTDETHPDGVIPINELTLPVTTAHAEGSKTASSELDTGDFTQPIPISGGATFACYTSAGKTVRVAWAYTAINGAVLVVMSNTQRQTVILYASPNNGDALVEDKTTTNASSGEQRHEYTVYQTRSSYTADGKTVYYSVFQFSHTISAYEPTALPEIQWYGDSNPNYRGPTAWTIIYGDVSGGTQEIPVQYIRRIDSKLLETSFTINVTT